VPGVREAGVREAGVREAGVREAVLALAAVLIGLVAALAANGARLTRAATAAPMTRRASGLRDKSWSAAFLRQRDPDAAGRPRPRAPSAAPAAA